jgi:hypothetical protein
MTGKQQFEPKVFGAIHDTVMRGGNNRFCKGNFFDGDTLHKVEIWRSESEGVMVLQLAATPRIETLRGYPAPTIDTLSHLLLYGVPARPDPRRKDFYELESDSEVFYVHISPVNGRVLLIGVWHRAAPRSPAMAAPVAQVA